MDRMNDDFFNDAEKVFPDTFKMVFAQEIFLLGTQLGQDGQVFALTPAHAKRLAQHLAHQIAQYEKQYGEVKAAWTPNIVSPIQLKPVDGSEKSG